MTRTAFCAAVLSLLAGAASAGDLVVGTEAGGVVATFTTPGLGRGGAIQPYGPTFTGGVRVAVGDVNGDGRADLITGVGRDGQEVKVFDGLTGGVIRDFNPFEAGYVGGVRVAAGDLNGDGVADLVVGAGAGGSQVRVFDGLTHNTLHDFNAFDGGFAGGVSVAVGDIDGDGREDVITGSGPGAAPLVKVFDGVTGLLSHSFLAFDPTFTGGVNVAGLTKVGGGRLAVSMASGGSQVRVFDGLTFTHDFFAFDPGFLGGVSLAFGAFGGFDSLIVGTQTGGSAIRVFDLDSGRQLRAFNAFAGDGGVNVASSFISVPEPAGWALMIGGFAMAGGMLRRRRAVA